MLIKTSELTGAALDWAVAKSMGGHIGVANGDVCFDTGDGEGFNVFIPSTDWAQGGPIIEREKIDRIATNVSGGFTASKKIVDLLDDDSFNVRWVHGSGPTPLIAAMRCYVASKFGDTVEIPDELFA